MKIISKNNMNRYSKTSKNIKKPKLHLNFTNAILLVFSVFIAFLFCFPILKIVYNSFNIDGNISMKAYKDMITSVGTYKALYNTMKLALGVLLLTWLLGGSLAFLCQKTDFKYSKLIDKLVFLSFCIPSYIISVSWVQITSKGGYLHRILKLLFNIQSYNFKTYSITACVLVMSVHLYPLVYFGISNALRKTGGVLEKSARICGGSSIHVMRTITLPLIIPAFLSTGLLIVSRSMANFGVLAYLALPVGSEVLTTRIFKAMSELNIPLVCVLSITLVIISSLIYIITQKYIFRRRFDIKDGASSNKTVIHLGKFSTIIYPIVFSFFMIVLVIPTITLIISSLMKRWGLSVVGANMTLINYKRVLFENTLIKRAIINSLEYGVVSAFIACIIGIAIIYIYKFSKKRTARLAMNIAIIPLALPNMILAIGAVFAWINKPLKLYGTKWIIIVTYVILFIPMIIKQIKGISENIDISMDNVAKTLGVPLFRRIKDIFLPLINRGVITGFLICFLIALREIPISLLLYSKGNETIGVMLFTIQSNSYGLEMTSAIAVIVIAISIIGNIIINKIGIRRLNK
ncbi:iron ABC transporter permease [Clostridiaceae bacterium M8S5]|nr:iron ABC transporter permease [Clostridiaceae bacterium M8S5]